MATTPIAADRIAAAVTAAHARHQKNRRGKNAGYIPALAKVAPQRFGVCVATVDGQTFSAGDARCQFALESISKVFTAALAMERVGPGGSSTARWAPIRLVRRSMRCWRWNSTTEPRPMSPLSWSTRGR